MGFVFPGSSWLSGDGRQPLISGINPQSESDSSKAASSISSVSRATRRNQVRFLRLKPLLSSSRVREPFPASGFDYEGDMVPYRAIHLLGRRDLVLNSFASQRCHHNPVWNRTTRCKSVYGNSKPRVAENYTQVARLPRQTHRDSECYGAICLRVRPANTGPFGHGRPQTATYPKPSKPAISSSFPHSLRA